MKAAAFTLSLSLLVIYVGSSLGHLIPGIGDGLSGPGGSYFYYRRPTKSGYVRGGLGGSWERGGGGAAGGGAGGGGHWQRPPQVYSSSRSDEHEEDQKAQLHPVGRSSSWDEHEEDQKDRSEQCPTPVGIGICVDLCGDDWSCPGEENCCSNGCGHVCTKPTPSCLDVNCLKGTICIVIDGKAQCAPLAQTDGSSSSDEHEEDQKGLRSSSGSFEESEEYGRDRDTDQRTARPSSPCTRAGAEHVITRVAEGVAEECSRILDWDDDLGSSLGADLLAAFDNFIDREGLALKESTDDD